MKNQDDNKKIVNISFFMMIFLLTYMCIVLYFGDSEMSKCEKIFLSIIIFLISFFSILCVWFSKSQDTNFCKDVIYIDDYVLYKGKKKTSICQIKYYENIKDIDKDSIVSKIYVKAGANIDQEIFDVLKNASYKFSVENLDSIILIKIQKENNDE